MSSRRNRVRLAVEALGHRIAPSSFVAAGDGPCPLPPIDPTLPPPIVPPPPSGPSGPALTRAI